MSFLIRLMMTKMARLGAYDSHVKARSKDDSDFLSFYILTG